MIRSHQSEEGGVEYGYLGRGRGGCKSCADEEISGAGRLECAALGRRKAESHGTGNM